MNYHTKQVVVENRYKRELDKLFLSLLTELDLINPLNSATIDRVIDRWFMFHELELLKLTQENLRDLSAIANEVVPQKFGNVSLCVQLINANMHLIYQELNKIRQQYKILATQQRTYNIPVAVTHERKETITNSTENSLQLLAVNQSILNARTLIFTNAIGSGYTEYLGKTQEDDRVRHTHWEYYQDKWIKFDNPPKIGHIGTEINCRCRAVGFR